MITATEDNIVKILDIGKNQVSPELKNLLEGHEAWKDTDDELNEHIYQFDETLYTIQWGDESFEEMKEIAILCNKFECNYFRLITV
jgi:hypothetical protein